MAKSKEVMSIQEQLRAEVAQLKDRVDPPSGYLISTKGKVFTLPDGSSNPGPLNCVILDWASSYTYFEGIYNPKDIKPPACFAFGRVISDMKPSDSAPKKMHENCKECPMNQWGSDPQGGKGKACKNMRRLLVVPIDADENAQPWVLRVSPTGIKHFDKYVSTLSDLDKHPIQVSTRIGFEENEAYPSLRFAVTGQLDDDSINLMWRLKERGADVLMAEPQVEAA